MGRAEASTAAPPGVVLPRDDARRSGPSDAVVAVVAVACGLTLVDAGGISGATGVVATAALVGVAGAQSLGSERRARARSALVPGAIFATYWLVAAHWWGTGVAGGRGLALGAVSLAAALTLSSDLSLRHAVSASRWIVRGSVAIAAVALVGYLRRSPGWAQPADGVWRLAGTFTYANSFALLIGLTMPFAAVRAAGAASPSERRWARVALLLAAAALTATMSRGAGVAVLVGLAALPAASRWRALLLTATGVAAALPLVATAGSARPSLGVAVPLLVALAVVAHGPGARVRAVLAVTAVALSCFAVVAAWSDLSEVVTDRLAWSSIDTRSPEWRAGLQQVREAPVFGVGPEQAVVLVDPDDGHEYWSRFLHNEYIQVAAGAGLAGLLLLGFLIARVATIVRAAGGAHAVATALTFTVGGLFDFSWHFPAVTMIAGLLLGLHNTESELP